MRLLLVILFTLCFSFGGFAQTYKCSYKDIENKKGKVTVILKGENLSAKIKRNTYSSSNCDVDRTLSNEIAVTCEEDTGKGMGFILTSENGKRFGYLVIEKISFLAELEC